MPWSLVHVLDRLGQGRSGSRSLSPTRRWERLSSLSRLKTDSAAAMRVAALLDHRDLTLTPTVAPLCQAGRSPPLTEWRRPRRSCKPPHQMSRRLAGFALASAFARAAMPNVDGAAPPSSATIVNRDEISRSAPPLLHGEGPRRGCAAPALWGAALQGGCVHCPNRVQPAVHRGGETGPIEPAVTGAGAGGGALCLRQKRSGGRKEGPPHSLTEPESRRRAAFGTALRRRDGVSPACAMRRRRGSRRRSSRHCRRCA